MQVKMMVKVSSSLVCISKDNNSKENSIKKAAVKTAAFLFSLKLELQTRLFERSTITVLHSLPLFTVS
jgi:hypothetical protein